MTEQELKDAVLQWFYEERREGLVPRYMGETPPGVTQEEFMRISQRLGAERLIDWTVYPGVNGMPDSGLGEITSLGIAFVEGRQSTVSAGKGGCQQRDEVLFPQAEELVSSLEALWMVIDQSATSISAKVEAKLRIRDLVQNPQVSRLLRESSERLLSVLSSKPGRLKHIS